jgi:hypothetical protein
MLASKNHRPTHHGHAVSYYHAITCTMLPFQLNTEFMVFIFNEHDYIVLD